MDEDINAIMEQLDQGIDINQETVKGLHEMEVQLHAISAIAAHFMQEGEWVEVLTDVSELIWDMLVALKMQEDGELHLIAEEQAAKKLGRNWTLKHRARIKDEILEETKHEKRIIQIITDYMIRINKLFDENQEEFHEDPEIHELCQRLHRLFNFYLQLFKKELTRLI
jgi:hypothetical protein